MKLTKSAARRARLERAARSAALERAIDSLTREMSSGSAPPFWGRTCARNAARCWNTSMLREDDATMHDCCKPLIHKGIGGSDLFARRCGDPVVGVRVCDHEKSLTRLNAKFKTQPSMTKHDQDC
jgi:hypothetical protein